MKAALIDLTCLFLHVVVAIAPHMLALSYYATKLGLFRVVPIEFKVSQHGAGTCCQVQGLRKYSIWVPIIAETVICL